ALVQHGPVRQSPESGPFPEAHRSCRATGLQRRNAIMTTRDVVFPPGRQHLYDRNRYSPAIRSDGLLFVSGQVGSREDGSVEPDLDAQVRLAFRNLNAVLAAAGCTFDDVIDVTASIVDAERNFERIWRIGHEYWGEAPYPTLTGMGV